MQASNRVVKNTAILYIRMAITMFISLYATRLVLGALGASDFGIFNLVGGAVVMLTFLNNAMAAATQRFMSFAQGEGNHQKQKKIFNVSIVLHFLIGIVLVILLEIAGLFLFNGILKIDPDRIYVAKLIFHFLVVSTFVKVISVPYDAVINSHEDMLFIAILGIFEAILKLCIAIYVTYTAFDKLSSYGLLMAALAILLLLIQRFYCHKKYKEAKFNFKYFEKSLFKEMTSFGGWSLLGSTAGMISNYGQGIVVNMFFGTIVNAAQGIANQISGQLSAFSTTMLMALNPIIAKSEGAGDRNLMLKASVSGSKFSFFLLSFFVIPVFIELPFILNFWLKTVPDYTITFCRLLLIVNLIDQMFVTLPTSISATGKIKNYQLSVSILAFLPLIMSYYLFKIGFPPRTIYIVFIGQRLIRAFGPILYYTNKLCGLSIKFYMKEVVLRCLSITICTFALSIIPLFFFNSGFMRLLIVLIASSTTFLFCLKWFGLSRMEENQLIQISKGLLTKLKGINTKQVIDE